MRQPVAAVLAGVVVAAVGAVILGEYPLVGFTPLLAGPFLGVAVGEATATVGRHTDRFLLIAVALVAQAALVWATWISTGHRLDTASPAAWAGVVLGSLAAPLWLKSAGRRGGRNPDDATRAPDG
ncbi:MAG: hypothetical protein KY439_02340 [Actinobacteria bacterium]|nr:hypothetical protein [Actinomycetota bacterium]